MSFSVDVCYADYFKRAARGNYNSGILKDRLIATAMGAGTAFAGIFRTLGRIINLVIEVAKVVFYAFATLFTLGKYGNDKRLIGHCKLLALNASGLVAQPLQVAIHSLAAIVGIVCPKAAYRMMQAASTPLAWITSHENKIWEEYEKPKTYTKIIETIKDKMTSKFDHFSWAVEITMKTLINEFSPAFDSALVAPLGFMDHFHSFGANPSTLTDEQKKLTPILLLNGNYSHQATFEPLLCALKKAGNKRPVYTINLPPHTVDPNFILPKIRSIMQQYDSENDFEIDMVGHSMGAGLIGNFARARPEGIKLAQAITVGSPTLKNNDDALNITGTKDCLIPSIGDLEIETGHLGLLFHPESLTAMVNFMKI